MDSQFKISSSKKSGMSRDLLPSPSSHGLFTEDEDREELNLALLDESDEEEHEVTQISKLSDLVNTDSMRKRRPVLTGKATAGVMSKSIKDPRLLNNRKLSRMSSGCVTPGTSGPSASGKFGLKLAKTYSPDSSSSVGSSDQFQFQFPALAGQQLGKKWKNPSLDLFSVRSPPSLPSPHLSDSPPDSVFKFGMTSRPAETSEDRQIKELEQNMVAGHKQLEMLKARKEARLAAEADLSRQRSGYQAGGQVEDGTGLGPLALREIQKQTQMVLNMQKNLMMERQRFEEEKRRQEQERKYQELQDSVERLQRQLQAKQGINPAGSIKDRVGPKNKLSVSVFSRMKKQESQNRVASHRHSGVKRKFTSSDQGQGKKLKKKNNNKNKNNKLPDDLVLTNITDQGPKKARARIDYKSLPEELVLTDLTEEGPKPRVAKIKEDDDKVVVEEDEDLNQYEGESGFIFD